MPEQRPLVLNRALFGAAAYGGMVLAVGNVSIFLFTIILNTTPFWTAMLGYYFLGEALTSFEFLCMIGCFAGVVTLTLSNESELETTERKKYLVEGESPMFGMFCSLVCAIGSAVVIVTTRKLK